MIILLYPMPLLAGALLLAVGFYTRNRLLRVAGDAFLTLALLVMIYQLYMTADHTSWIEHGLFLNSWSDYIGFAGSILVAGLLAGDGLAQVLYKKSSSS